jgi:hypothetical protein
MIQAPKWCKDAVPTLKGWKHPRRNEILKPIKLTQEQIDEWHGIISKPVVTEPPSQMGYIEPDDDVVIATFDVVNELESMTKKELEEFGREEGIELDRRKSKTALLSDLKKWVKK